MKVRIFRGPFEYQKWVGTLAFPIEIISVLTVHGEIVLTYKQK